jgi:hypothetical protein
LGRASTNHKSHLRVLASLRTRCQNFLG